MKLAQNVATSTMWIQREGERIPEKHFADRASGRWAPPPTKMKPSKIRRYKDSNLPLDRIAEFQTVNGALVHIIEAKEETGDPLEDALTIVRAVDLRCCGVAVDRFGRILEAVEGGFDDCKSLTLRINKYDPLRDEERTIKRIQKYIGRGWKLATSIDVIRENFHKAQEEYARQQAAKKAAEAKKKKKSLPKGFKILDSKTREAKLVIASYVVKKFGTARLEKVFEKAAIMACSAKIKRRMVPGLHKVTFLPQSGMVMNGGNWEATIRHAEKIMNVKYDQSFYPEGKPRYFASGGYSSGHITSKDYMTEPYNSYQPPQYVTQFDESSAIDAPSEPASGPTVEVTTIEGGTAYFTSTGVISTNEEEPDDSPDEQNDEQPPEGFDGWDGWEDAQNPEGN
jgi:hypothetical protein